MKNTKDIIKNNKDLLDEKEMELLQDKINQSRIEDTANNKLGFETSNLELEGLDDSVSLKIKESLEIFKEEVNYKGMDSIDRSYSLFNYEGGASEEKSIGSDVVEDVESDSISPLPMFLTDENLKIFKDRFVVEKIVENIKNGSSLNPEHLKILDAPQKFNLKVNIEAVDDNEPLFRIEGTKLKLSVNLDKGHQILDRGVEFIKKLTIEEIEVAGNIIPILGTYFFYRKISTLFANHLDKQLIGLSGKSKVRQINLNNKTLLLFNIFACLPTAIFFSVGIQAIKNRATANIKSIVISGEVTEPSSNITKSFTPLFILNKFKNLLRRLRSPNWANFICLYICMSLCYRFIKLNYSSLSEYFNYNYLFIIFSLFLLYILYFIFKVLIIVYYVNYKENLLENKTYKYLPTSFKEDITIYRESDSETQKIIINNNLYIALINLFLLFLGIIFLNFIYFVVL